jgi:hypothetical protein
VFDGKTTISCGAKLEAAEVTFKEDSMSLTAKRITHNFGGDSGSLKLELWACSQPAVNGCWNGYKLGETQLDPLKKGIMYNEVTRNIPFTRPPTGSYFIIIQLHIYENKWVCSSQIGVYRQD